MLVYQRVERVHRVHQVIIATFDYQRVISTNLGVSWRYTLWL